MHTSVPGRVSISVPGTVVGGGDELGQLHERASFSASLLLNCLLAVDRFSSVEQCNLLEGCGATRPRLSFASLL